MDQFVYHDVLEEKMVPHTDDNMDNSKRQRTESQV